MKWAWGVLSAPDVQELAMAIKMSGNDEEEIEELASLGAHGLSLAHSHRDLERRFCKELWSPQPMSYNIPYKDNRGKPKEVLFTQTKMYLISDWLRALSQNPNLEYEFDALFGI
eukprot:7584469-Lingulodinium_polyedra.AAC.1